MAMNVLGKLDWAWQDRKKLVTACTPVTVFFPIWVQLCSRLFHKVFCCCITAPKLKNKLQLVMLRKATKIWCIP